MTLYAFSIDLDRCIGCQACTVACKTGNELPVGDAYIKVRDIVLGQMPKLFGTFAHQRCHHCADAACVTVCPTGTLTKAANGMTAVAVEKCVGCGYCVTACPYDVPRIVDGHVSKCVACMEPVAAGEQPYCVQTCPSQAIKYGERDKILADAKARVAALKTRYPNAQVYGESQLGGLGLFTVMLDKPDTYGLLENPRLPSPMHVWQVAHPFTVPMIALSVAVTGVSYFFARREHAREKAEAAKAAMAALVVTPTAGAVEAVTAQTGAEATPPAAQSGDQAETALPAQASDAEETAPGAQISEAEETPPAAQVSDGRETPPPATDGTKEEK